MLEIVVGGFALAVGVWLLLALLDWLSEIGAGFTPEQARRRTLRWLARQQPHESPAETRRK
jgi:hypothetical protein